MHDGGCDDNTAASRGWGKQDAAMKDIFMGKYLPDETWQTARD
jgi:hypothetical protein